MKTVRDLAEAEMKVSEAANALEALKGMETAYITEREGRAGAAVERVIADSEDVLTRASENNEAAASLAAQTTALAGRTIDLFGAVKGLMQRFDEKAELWEKNMKDRENKFTDEKNGLTLLAQRLSDERKNLDKQALALNDAEARIDSKRQDVEKMITNKPV